MLNWLIGCLIFFAIVLLVKGVVVVPEQQAYIVERLGRKFTVLRAGIHFLIPFVDIVAYKHSLKEHALDISRQICITRDNVQVDVDGVVYLQVLDAERASYGVSNFLYAITQLVQTTLRSEIGKIELDKLLEERSSINLAVVAEVDKAAAPWGVKVLRYEIQNITPPADSLAAMQKLLIAERHKRAIVFESEGKRDSEINYAEGERQRLIKESEGKKLAQINEAEGQAAAVLAMAQATADGIALIANAIRQEGGESAMSFRIAEQYIKEFGKLAQNSNTMVLSADVADVGSMITMAKGMLKKEK